MYSRNNRLPDLESMDFHENLDNSVFSNINDGFDQLAPLLERFPGLYPATLVDSLRRLESTGRISTKVLHKLGEPSHSLDAAPPSKEDMPVPHPLDFDWRFTKETRRRLLNMCLSLSSPDDLITFLGCPTVFKESFGIRSQRRFLLLDKNPFYSSQANDHPNVCLDLLSDPVPHVQAQVALADPPWYQSYEQAFLEKASSLVRLGGFILTTQPTEWTKPNARSDWASIIACSKRIGLNPLATLTATVRYDSPYFEQNSLRAAGLDNIPRAWRRGDLILFQKGVDRPPTENIDRYRYDDWLRESHFGFRIRNHGQSTAGKFKDPGLISIVAGDVLSSVSRTDPTRSLADVWTVGNRIFACQGTEILQRILLAIEIDQSPVHTVGEVVKRELRGPEKVAVSRAVRQVVSIINLERNERRCMNNLQD